jgi:hypothetical protein
MNDIYIKYKEYAKLYCLSNHDIGSLWKIIRPIALHEEFVKRCQGPYYHHDIKMLGDHILCDTIVTYKLCKKLQKRNINVNLKNACLIAMFHDLYELPWQNINCKKKLINKHGFVHPLEAAINAITWFPEYFEQKNTALMLLDGIIHHMYPFPVRVIDDEMDLNNQKKWNNLPKKYQELILLSTNLGSVGKLKFRKSYYLEGRVMAKADKIVSCKMDFKNLNGLLTLIGKYNKKIEK